MRARASKLCDRRTLLALAFFAGGEAVARAPLRPCRHAGCPVLTREGWCDRHRPTHQRRESADWHDWYSLPIWRKRLRPTQLIREPFCRDCAREGVRTPAEIVDHITPHRGRWKLFTDPENLQSLCKHHHDQKTMREQRQMPMKRGGL